MWRPYNETKEHLENEDRVAKILSDKWNVDVLKLSPMLYTVDWAFSRNKHVTAYGEFKKLSHKYDTLMISAAKIMKMEQWHEWTRLPVLLIVEWPDGLWYFDISSNKWGTELKIGGSSRGQPGDIEPMVYIPVSKFKSVST